MSRRGGARRSSFAEVSVHALQPGSVAAQIRPSAFASGYDATSPLDSPLLGCAVEFRSIRSRYRVWAGVRHVVPRSR